MVRIEIEVGIFEWSKFLHTCKKSFPPTIRSFNMPNALCHCIWIKEMPWMEKVIHLFGETKKVIIK